MRQILEPDQSDPCMFQPNFLLHFSELGLQTRFFASEKFIFVWTELTGQKGTPTKKVDPFDRKISMQTKVFHFFVN